MPLSEGHLQWMAHTRTKAANVGIELSVCILEYGSVLLQTMAAADKITRLHSSSDVEAHQPESHTPSAPNDNEKESTNNFGPAPDGGLKAWLVAAGAACTIFSTLGFANSFGVLQEYYAANQLRGQSADRIAWIGSLSAFLQFAAGGLGGPLFDRYGAWVSNPFRYG
jgi:hypothetical protein